MTTFDRATLGALGFGAAPLGNLYRPLADAAARATVRAAWDSGIRYFDTAPHYGFGLSEKRLGAALAQLDPGEHAIVSTKVGRRLDPVPDADLSQPRQGFVSPEPVESVFDYSYDAVMRGYEASRTRLGRDRIDILYAHDLGRATHGDAHPHHFRTFIEGGYKAMRALRDAGAVRAIGVGVNEVAICEQLLATIDLDLVLLAGRYTLLDQAALDKLLPLCAGQSVGVVIGGPYNSGILAQGVANNAPVHYDYAPPPAAILSRVAGIEALCATHHVPMAVAALRFPLAHPQVVSVIPGAVSPDEVAAGVAAMTTPIPAALWADLKRAGLLHPDAPVAG
ncbi:aldo/keto reductase [Hephaestia sp. GCM10023244]|uniref:aldo/keto reductase n=1 Tax=unclassified Hephaestia TaxID=2631281 RepID=UPI0020773B07|nr:aldo/keto reductase [Hephaestia sp. MAHUQ-44]MCM8729978.1 aldo/keto reductase [Hephaestia sp. MAHUQ-44]